MEVRWLTAFLDLSAERFDAGAEFWCQVTATTMSATRGDRDEFVTLVPSNGDPYLGMQRIAAGSSGIHLDVHVDAPRSVAPRAEDLGASRHADHDSHLVMRSPGGFAFCLVPHHGEQSVPAALDTPRSHRLDQVCLDITPEIYDTECNFWASLTGWPIAQSRLSEFRSLQRPNNSAVRLLLQRRDAAPTGDTTHGHFDIACGNNIDEIADHHVALGATRVGRTKVWMAMIDPAGLPYCLTPRTA